MVRLRSALACIYVFALLAAATTATAQTSGTNWNLINAPSTGPQVTTQGTAPPAASQPDHLYLLNGSAGVNESPLPQSIKDDLLGVSEDPYGGGVVSIDEEDGEETVYIVGQEIVQGLEASEAAGELTPEIEAIAEPLDEEEEATSSAITANGIFGKCATHEGNTTRTVSLNGKSWSGTPDLGSGFTGTYALTGDLQGSVTAELKYGIKRRKIFGKCVPYGLEFKTLHAFGNATSDGGVTLDGTLNYSKPSFGPWELAKPELFDVVFYVGPIPVRVILNMPITADLGVSLNLAGQVNYNGTHVATGSFDYTCTLSTCTGSHTFSNTGENGNDQQITGHVEGRVKPTIYVDVAFRGVLYAEWFAYGQVGVRPYLLGDLWGYAGNQCGDADGDGDFETVRAFTFDLDRRIDLTRESRVFNGEKKQGTIHTGQVKHVGFYDITNSNAMQPYLLGPASRELREPGDYKVRMRPCWPYTDPVKYRLNWGDGSEVQEVQGAPATEVTASHSWDTAGNKTVTATSWRDDHGRSLDQTFSRTIEVKVPVPLDVTVTPSPVSATYGTTITWTATATGGNAASTQYAFFRRLAGATDWIPAVTAPAWQPGNVLQWTPGPADVGVWEIIVWVKDRNTAPDANGYGYADYVHAGNVQVVPPLVLSCPAASPRTVTSGNATTWTISSVGGTPGTIQYTLSRNPVGTTNYAPLAWQTGNVLSWTPTATEVGTWQVSAVAKDLNTPANPGYTSYCNLGQVTVVSPLSLSVTPSPSQAGAGNAITWTATATGGVPASTQYALFRRRAGTTPWTPDVTAPAWQSTGSLSWTPAAADAGTWEIIVWVKDGNTPATMNTYGYAAYANAGPVEVKAPLAVTVTASPAYSTSGNPITWTATATGGDAASIQYTLGRRRAGATDWLPSPLVWQSGNVLSWTPTSADVGTWEIAVGVRDRNTPPGANGLGYSAAAVSTNVQVVAPLTLTVTPSPATSPYGTAITWTATASGGVPATTRFAFFRRRSGTTPWIPDVTAPNWQTSNTYTWTPTSADAGSWDTYVWVKDSLTPANMNTYGYAAGFNTGGMQITTQPLTVTGTGSPASSYHGVTLTWTATASGGTPSTTKYAFFRRRAGTTPWTPDVTAPAWQTSNVLSWTPSSADTGTWEIIIWVKDGDTPASQNTYGYGAYYNAGPVQIVAPPTLSVTGSPAASVYGNAITWTASATSSNPSSLRYAFFRRRSGTTPWIPDVTAANWQTSNTFTWTPTSADTGTWDTYVWVKDSLTPASMNTYGYAAGFNTGGVRIVAPLSGLSCSGTPSGTSGNLFTWTCSVSGGDAATRQFAFFRRRAGATTWIPSVTTPAWQSSNVMTWTPSSSDTGTWETYVWVRDYTTPANANTYGYALGTGGGNTQVFAPLSVTASGTPSTSPYGATITWTANASGGNPATTKYAFFRRLSGATAWIPDVTAANWQTSNTFSWTPTSSDVGSWVIIVWVKDGNTPATMNTYGYAAYYNAGAVDVTTPAPVTVSGTGSPATSPAGTTISWTATASGGIPSTYKYALFRRKAGTSNWIPDVTAPNWQTSRTLSWTPSASDTGTWEIIIWVKDINTTPSQNGYGFAAYYNAQPVQVY